MCQWGIREREREKEREREREPLLSQVGNRSVNGERRERGRDRGDRRGTGWPGRGGNECMDSLQHSVSGSREEGREGAKEEEGEPEKKGKKAG